VFPALAAREHDKNLPLVMEQALREGGLALRDLDAVAVAAGPGLAPCLKVGLDFSKKLCAESEQLKLV
jgi:N6-L-threonylcarbamoyladenine synthase